MRKFALLTNYTKDKTLSMTYMIRDYLTAKGCECWLPELPYPDAISDIYVDVHAMPKDVECVLVLGGDGTLLKAARDTQQWQLPILGINIGTLGFLTAAEKSELPDCLDCLLDDSYEIEKRMMLKGTVKRQTRVLLEETALNDIIVTRAGFSRLVEVRIYVNDELLNIYGADGVIVSTPTGSTGYNLSAGGPIVFPQTDVMIVTPICPHSLQARSMVVSGSDKIKIEIGKRRKTQKEEAMVTFDGRIAEELETADYIEICKAQETTQLIRLKGKRFYEVFQNKIGSV